MEVQTEPDAPPAALHPASLPPRPRREVIYRHSLVVRLTHWVNVLAISLLLMSGLQIFNAHPRLYWGQYGADFDAPLLEMTATGAAANPVGVTRVAGHAFTTTGLFGVSPGRDFYPSVGAPSFRLGNVGCDGRDDDFGRDGDSAARHALT